VHTVKPIFCPTILILFISSFAVAADSQPCKVTYPPVLQNGYTYTGGCVNGLADGAGTVRTTGAVAYGYTGQFKNGKYNGQGMEIIGTSKWSGNYINGRIHGSCKIEHATIGATYIGQCVNGERRGYGKLMLGGTVSATYEGQWDGKNLRGKGKYTSSDGSSYTGNFDNGVYHGYGIEKMADGRAYQGSFNQGTWHGKGILTLANGKRYSGVWSNGLAVSGDVMKLSSPPPPSPAPRMLSHQGSEVSKCYAIAWDHPSNGGLGLHRGGAIELCKGTKNAMETTNCFRQAWNHPDNGGLGLHLGGAVDLCKASND